MAASTDSLRAQNGSETTLPPQTEIRLSLEIRADDSCLDRTEAAERDCADRINFIESCNEDDEPKNVAERTPAPPLLRWL